MKNTPTDRVVLRINKLNENAMEEILNNPNYNIVEIHLEGIEFTDFIKILNDILKKNVFKTIIIYEGACSKDYRNVKKIDRK